MKDDISFRSIALLAIEKSALRRMIFSSAKEGFSPKIVVRLCKNGKKTVLAQEQTLADGKVHHRNYTPDEFPAILDQLEEGYFRINILTSAGDAEYRCNRKGSSTVIGGEKLFRALDGKSFSDALTETLDRQKEYLLKGDEPFLVKLGISDQNGRIHDKKQAKYRQINRFLEHIRDIEADLPTDGVLRIYDLCSGKSYLSFAVYHYFSFIKGREVEMLCMDLKSDVMKDCAEIAEALHYGGMHFVSGDVRHVPRDPAPDMVLSLHACDIATDIVLHTAAAVGARVVLSTPCCHRDLSEKLDTPSLSFVTRYPHLKKKLSEVLTDALRLSRLRAYGYEVAALELTDPDDTPKNTLLRARRCAMSEDKRNEAQAEFRALIRFLTGKDCEDYPEEILK